MLRVTMRFRALQQGLSSHLWIAATLPLKKAPRALASASSSDCESWSKLIDALASMVRLCASQQFPQGRADTQVGTMPRRRVRCARNTAGARIYAAQSGDASVCDPPAQN